jgi:RNA polymerase sigma-70 factor (ECF subfamily)
MAPPLSNLMILKDDFALARACGAGDPGALARVEAELFPNIRIALRRMSLSPPEVEDVMQTFRTELFVRNGERPPRIVDYEGRGPLVAWLRVGATRLALRLRQKTRREVPSEDDALLASCASGDDPELAFVKESCRADFRAAFQQALNSLTDRDRTLLRMKTVDELSVDEIGAVFQVHRATAARWVAKAETTLVGRTRTELMRRARVTREECDSMIRLVQSQLGATLRRRILAAG